MRTFYVIGFLLWGTHLQAQDSTITLRRPYRVVFKLAPLALLDQDATVQAGLEYRTGRRTSVQGEVGYGWKGLSVFTADLDQFTDAEVWRARGEVRFYSGRYRTNQRKGIAWRSRYPLGNYWAVEGLYKQINVFKQDNIYSRESSSQTGTYAIIGTSQRPISRYVLGGHLKIGRQFSSYEPQRRVFTRTLFDIYVGAGVRWASNRVSPAPFDPYPTCGCGFGRSLTSEGTVIAPSLTAGLKFGFAL